MVARRPKGQAWGTFWKPVLTGPSAATFQLTKKEGLRRALDGDDELLILFGEEHL